MTTDSPTVKSLASFIEQTSTSAGFEDSGILPFSLTVDGLGSDDVREIGRLAGEAKRVADKMNSAINRFLEIGNSIEDLLAGLPVELPVGLSQNIGGLTFHLVLLEMQLKPTHAEVDVALGVQFPGSLERLLLGATDVEFSREGGFGDLRLELIDVFGINIAQGKSRLVFYPTVVSNANSVAGTYAEVTCGGLQSLNLNASLILSRDWALPIRFGEPLTDEILVADEEAGLIGQMDVMTRQKYDRVHWDFNIQAGNGNFFIETGSRDSFVIADIPDVHIYAEDVTLDFSDTRNPTGLHFPDNYNCPYLVGGEMMNLWRGVYIRGVFIRLPEQWRRNNAAAVEVYGESIIIDERGLTGMLGVNNLLPLNEGKAGGWALSVDTFQLHFMQSQVEAARFAGLVNVPLLENDNSSTEEQEGIQREDCLAYLAHIEPGSYYRFVAETQGDYRVPMWKSEIIVREGTSLNLEYYNEQLRATATIYADLNLELQIGSGFALTADTLSVNHLVLASEGGIQDYGIWEFPTSISAQLGAFEVFFEEIDFYDDPNNQHQPTLSIVAGVEIGAGGTDLAALGAFRIIGENVVEAEVERYRYDRFAVDAFAVNMSTSAYGVSAVIAMYEDDPIYGSGFYGMGDLWLSALGGSEEGIAAVAQFGSKVDEQGPYKYFFVNALARLGNQGPPLGTFNLHGVGGGLWVNMTMDDDGLIEIPEDADNRASNEQDEILAAVEATSEGYGENESSPMNQFIGSTLNGLRLLPNRANDFGIQLQVVIATQAPSEKAVSVNGTFQLEINGSQGWNVRIYGNATFFDDINWRNEPPEQGFTAIFDIAIVRDINRFSLSAEALLYLELGLLNGTANRDEVDMPADSTNQPAAQAGANLAGYIALYWDNQGDWYINLGHPAIAPLQLGLDLNSAIQTSVSAYLDLGTNIPAMPPLPHYVTNITGGTNNFMRNESLYASGNGVAFGVDLNLSVSPRLPIFFVDINAGLGFDLNLQQYHNVICLETGRPPGVNNWYAAGQAWAFLEGAVGMEFRLFLARVRVTILEAAVAASLQMKGPNPFWGSGRVAARFSVLGGLIRGQFRMGFQLGRECTMASDGGGDVMANAELISATTPVEGAESVPTDGRLLVLCNFPVGEIQHFAEEEYLLEIGEISLNGSEGVVPAEVQFEIGDFGIVVQPQNMLTGNTNYTFLAEVNLRKISTNQIVNDTVVLVSFTTGAAYDYIPASNVLYSYPLDGQYNVYREEASTGYVQLIQGQDELLSQSLESRFVGSNGGEERLDVIYDANHRRLSFDFPNLIAEDIYSWQILPNDSSPEGSLLQIYFRTSNYETMAEKMAAILDNRQLDNPSLDYILPSQVETFGRLELAGGERTAPLLQFEADKTCSWYDDLGFQDLLYDHVPAELIGNELSFRLENTWRPEEWGTIPTRAVFVSTDQQRRIVQAVDFEEGTLAFVAYQDTFKFHFPTEVVNDAKQYYRDLRSALLNWADIEIAHVNFMVENFEPVIGSDSQIFTEHGVGLPVNCQAVNWSPDEYVRRFLEECNDESLFGVGVNWQCQVCPDFTNALNFPTPSWWKPLFYWSGYPAFNPGNEHFDNYYENEHFPVNINYYLPGQTTPNSTVTIQVRTGAYGSPGRK